MEKIEFEDGVYIYQTNLGSYDFNEPILTATKSFLKTTGYSPKDNYGYVKKLSIFDFENEISINNGVDEIVRLSVLKCMDLMNQDNKIFNKINLDAWVNLLRTKKPRQSEYFKRNGDVVLHNHVDIQNENESFYPTYTFVYYTQMPDNLSENDGTLIIGGKNDRYYYLPKVGDLVIMGGEVPHSPSLAPKSTKDRIVIAGNVGFEYVKQKRSLI